MKSEKLKNYLQSYFDSVIKPRVDRTRNELGFDPVDFTVHDVVKGSYQPPIYHAFIDMEPNWEGSYRKKIENDISDFMKILSINNKLKVHWNKRPSFKGSETPKPFYGTQEK